jgi:hypothetical protein
MLSPRASYVPEHKNCNITFINSSIVISLRFFYTRLQNVINLAFSF